MSTIPESQTATRVPAVSSTKFRLLDLPAELRNRIYDFALVSDLPFKIKLRTKHGEQWPGFIWEETKTEYQDRLSKDPGQPAPPHYVPRLTDTRYGALPDEERRKVHLGKNDDCGYPGASVADVSVHLLRTCRKIHKEATPILYGANTFHFYDIDGLPYRHYCMPKETTPRPQIPDIIKGFQKEIGTSLQYIRTVQFRTHIKRYFEIRYDGRRDIGARRFRRDLVALEGFTGLERLDIIFAGYEEALEPDLHTGIGQSALQTSFRPRAMAQKLLPFVEALAEKQKREHGRDTDLSDLVNFACEQQWEGLQLCRKHHFCQGLQALTRQDIECNRTVATEGEKTEYKKKLQSYDGDVKAELMMLLEQREQGIEHLW